MNEFKDPVFLSGGDKGGEVVEGDGWKVDEERIFDKLIYRRIEDDSRPETTDTAVFCGKA